jgi:hypothetical protein
MSNGNLQRVESWVATMQRLGEADIPTEIGGMIMTPNQLLQHARSNDAVWQQVQNSF